MPVLPCSRVGAAFPHTWAEPLHQCSEGPGWWCQGTLLSLWGPLGLWGGAWPMEGVMAGRDEALGWPELFKQGSALCVGGGRSVGEEQRRGLPKASVRPCCLVCQTWLDLAGARPPRCEGWGLAGGAEPDRPFMCCWTVFFVVGLAVFVPFWKQCPFPRASAPERGEQPSPFVSNLSSALCQCLRVVLTPPGVERSIFPAGLELLIWNCIRQGSSKVLSYFKSGLPPPVPPLFLQSFVKGLEEQLETETQIKSALPGLSANMSPTDWICTQQFPIGKLRLCYYSINFEEHNRLGLSSP